jgi:hypothetical protein
MRGLLQEIAEFNYITLSVLCTYLCTFGVNLCGILGDHSLPSPSLFMASASEPKKIFQVTDARR